MKKNFIYDILPDELVEKIFLKVHKDKFNETLKQINEDNIFKIRIAKFVDKIIDSVLRRLNDTNWLF